MSDNVEKMIDYSDNCHHWSVEQMLEEAMSAHRSGEIKGDQAVTIFLDKSDGQYQIRWRVARLKGSEVVALLECAKADMLRAMGY